MASLAPAEKAPAGKPLKVGSPHDPAEREADRIADILTAPEEPALPVCAACAAGGAPCPACGGGEGAGGVLRRRGAGGEDGAPGGEWVAPPSVHRVLREPGEPLPEGFHRPSATSPSPHAFFAQRLGEDLNDVRVHTDGAANQSARDLQAQAYTAGSHVVFAQGEFAPHTRDGQRLLTHELTHVAQQQNGSNIIQRACGAEAIGNPSGCEGVSMEVPLSPRYLFQVSCDDFAPGNELDLRMDALSIQPGERIEIHGLASEEGSLEFNIHLACARAQRARAVMEEVLRDRGVSASFSIFTQGPQASGERYLNRAVVILRSAPPVPEVEAAVEPGEPAQCVLSCSDGRDETSDPDHDLDQLRHSGDYSPDIWVYDNILGESGALSDYRIGFFSGTFFESTSDDDALFIHFVSGDGSRLNLGSSSDMATIFGDSSDFLPFARGFESEIAAHIRAHRTLCGFDCDSQLVSRRPDYFHNPLFAWAVMGGYSKVMANVSYDHSTGIVTILYQFTDHYGAGVTDAWSALPGLSALYYLQHFHGIRGTQYTPFIWSVEISRSFTLSSSP